MPLPLVTPHMRIPTCRRYARSLPAPALLPPKLICVRARRFGAVAASCLFPVTRNWHRTHDTRVRLLSVRGCVEPNSFGIVLNLLLTHATTGGVCFVIPRTWTSWRSSRRLARSRRFPLSSMSLLCYHFCPGLCHERCTESAYRICTTISRTCIRMQTSGLSDTALVSFPILSTLSPKSLPRWLTSQSSGRNVRGACRGEFQVLDLQLAHGRA